MFPTDKDGKRQASSFIGSAHNPSNLVITLLKNNYQQDFHSGWGGGNDCVIPTSGVLSLAYSLLSAAICNRL